MNSFLKFRSKSKVFEAYLEPKVSKYWKRQKPLLKKTYTKTLIWKFFKREPLHIRILRNESMSQLSFMKSKI